MTIGELARQIGVNVQTIRFYERRQLLPEPPRTQSGYREYGPNELNQLNFVRHAKSLGFSLDEIRQILRTRSQGECPCTDVLAVAEQHLAQISQQIAQLEQFKQQLARAVREWKKAGPQTLPSDAICVLIERTIAKTDKNSKTRIKR